MNSWITINVLLNLLTLLNSILTILICSFVLLLIIIFHRRPCSVPILLAGHTSSTLLISAFMLGGMATASLFGYLGIVLKQHGNTIWCRWRGFLVHGFVCAVYDSYALQAAYRLCRVVYYRRKSLHSFPMYSLLVPVQTFVSILSISPVLFHGDVIYLPSEYYCQTPFTNILAINYIAIRLLLMPILFIVIAYIYILRHIRRSNSSAAAVTDNSHRRSKQNKRDLTVVKRLLIMLSSLVILGLPSVVFLIILMFTGYLIPVTYRIGWLTVSFTLLFLACMLIRLTIPLKKTVKQLFKGNNCRRICCKSSFQRDIPLHDL